MGVAAPAIDIQYRYPVHVYTSIIIVIYTLCMYMYMYARARVRIHLYCMYTALPTTDLGDMCCTLIVYVYMCFVRTIFIAFTHTHTHVYTHTHDLANIQAMGGIMMLVYTMLT